MIANAWDPDQYERFERERAQPFFDLLAMVQPCPRGRVVDLGCGPGTRTMDLARAVQAAEVVGLDHSEAMLRRARATRSSTVRFEQADISQFADVAAWDLVFSNAALHWVDDHDTLCNRLIAALRPNGQIAFQVPANFDHPASAVASALAAEEPYAEALGARRRGGHVDAPERYAERLYAAGVVDIDVQLRVYLHELPGPEAVIEWTRGSTLTWYETRLGPDRFARFETEYRERLLATLSDARPFLFTFKRLFVYGRMPP